MRDSPANSLRIGAVVVGMLVACLSMLIWICLPTNSVQSNPMTDQQPLAARSGSTLESGRIRVCGGLLTSLNRSWQVVGKPGQWPAASFKGLAPLAAWSAAGATTDNQNPIYLAAIAPHDAFWIGFEADPELNFAVTIDLDGRNALSGERGWSRGLTHNPKNFLLIPDQPWLDARVGQDGSLQQLIPSFGEEVRAVGIATGAEIRLTVYPIPSADLEFKQPPQAQGPQPQYAPDSATAAKGQPIHPWQGRTLRRDAPEPEACAKLSVAIVQLSLFESLTHISLPEGLFDDADSTPPPPPPLF